VEGELVVPELPLEEGERPVTVGVDGVLGRVVVVGPVVRPSEPRGAVVGVVLRPPPPHHQPPTVEPERVLPLPVVVLLLLLLPEPHRSGCHCFVCALSRHVVPTCCTWQASIVGYR
jgi:hypothetical protein